MPASPPKTVKKGLDNEGGKIGKKKRERKALNTKKGPGIENVPPK